MKIQLETFAIGARAARPRVQCPTTRGRAVRAPIACGILSQLQLRKKAADAFTLIEIMVVVIILGILAATIIPQFIGTAQDAKIAAAKTQVGELENAVGRFYVQMDRYPTADEGLKVLVEAPAGADQKWRGPYVKQIRNDPWGNPFQYGFPGTHNPTSFDIWSRGSDGADGGEGDAADIGNW